MVIPVKVDALVDVQEPVVERAKVDVQEPVVARAEVDVARLALVNQVDKIGNAMKIKETIFGRRVL